VECYAPGEAVGQTAYSSIVGLLAERIEYETPLQKSYMHQGYSFNYLVNEDGLCFMVSAAAPCFLLSRAFSDTAKKKTQAVAKADFQTRICFAFLARVVNEYNPGSRYKTQMAQHMDFFSNNSGADKIRNIQSEVDKVKVVMQKNIDDILMRGEKLEKLVEDTEKLETNSKQFKEGATSLKYAMWCRNVKLTIAIIVIVLVVAFFIVVGACGGFSFPKCGGGQTTTTGPATTTSTTTTTAGPTAVPRNLL
jgi:vesicle-associated membrane protein 7